ncbi:MAG: hypothetical protein QXW91_00585 [Candidatus Nitrosotenuis sp.]
MSAAKKLDDAQKILECIREENSESVAEFTRAIHDVYSSLLDEYNKKFACHTGHISLAKFKSSAKKAGNVKAISFLIWYEREFHTIRNDPRLGFLLDNRKIANSQETLQSCSELLKRTRDLVYHAYENY